MAASRVEYNNKVVNIPVMAQRQVPSAQRVQRTVEVPQNRDQTVEVARQSARRP